MNVLINIFPTFIEIDGKEYEIDTDFRACLRIILAFEDPELVMVEKQMLLLDILYKEKPDNTRVAFEQGMKFLNGGEDADEEEEFHPRLYSFEKDARFIMAAFQQTHGIDLETADMHWWKFISLFMDMGQDTTFSNIVGLRSRLKSGKASKEEREAAREMGDILELPELDMRTLEEHEAEEVFMQQVEAGR